MGNVKKVDHNMADNKWKDTESITWLRVDDERVRLSGFEFYQKDHRLNRLPKEDEETFQKVNPCLLELGEHTAGGQIAFRSNTTKLIIKAKLKNVHNMVNMTPAGQCGFDCYIGKDRDNLKFYGVTKYDITQDHYTCEVVNNLSTDMKEFLINFPLYCSVEEVEFGIDKKAEATKPTPYAKEGKLVFYGTSITQGGCASRPGMAYTSMVSRQLNLEHLNFGFSGNGLGEIEVAQMLSKVENPLLYVIDYEANSGTNGRMAASLEDFVNELRCKHKDTPIMVLSRIPYLLDTLEETHRKQRNDLREFQYQLVKKHRETGDDNIFFCDGSKLWGEGFDEFTVDTIHPTDLGFYFMTKELYPVIQNIVF